MLCFWILPRHSLEQTTTTADRGPNISRGPNPSCSKKLFPPRLPAAPHISRPSFRETSRTWVGFLDPLPIKSSSPGNPPLSVRSLGQHLSPLPLLRSDVPAGSFLKPFLGGKQSCLCFAPIWCEIAVALASIALFWNCAAIGFEKPRGLQVQGHTVQACICVYAGHCVSTYEADGRLAPDTCSVCNKVSGSDCIIFKLSLPGRPFMTSEMSFGSARPANLRRVCVVLSSPAVQERLMRMIRRTITPSFGTLLFFCA